jgi:hypothetical protein
MNSGYSSQDALVHNNGCGSKRFDYYWTPRERIQAMLHLPEPVDLVRVLKENRFDQMLWEAFVENAARACTSVSALVHRPENEKMLYTANCNFGKNCAYQTEKRCNK